MIPMLILYLVRKFKNKPNLLQRVIKLKRFALGLIVGLILLIVTSSFSSSNSNSLTYKVIKKKDVIGFIKISKTVSGNTVAYSLKSNIKAKYVFNFNIEGEEKSIFRNDTLIFSSVFRKLNNKVKADFNLSFDKGQYKLKSKKDQTVLNVKPIRENLITLYFNEPKNLKQVYCDNQNEMVTVKRISNGVYRVNFSSGKYNTFYYKNKKCVKVEAVSPMFNVTLISA